MLRLGSFVKIKVFAPIVPMPMPCKSRMNSLGCRNYATFSLFKKQGNVRTGRCQDSRGGRARGDEFYNFMDVPPRGFTVVELLVGLLILVVTFLVAVPELLEWQADNELRVMARSVVSHFQHARLEAVKHNGSAEIQVTAGEGPKGGCVVVREGETIKQFTLPPGMKLTSGGTFQFNFRGFPDTTGTVTITNGNKAYDITLKLTGMTTLTEGDVPP